MPRNGPRGLTPAPSEHGQSPKRTAWSGFASITTLEDTPGGERVKQRRDRRGRQGAGPPTTRKIMTGRSLLRHGRGVYWAGLSRSPSRRPAQTRSASGTHGGVAGAADSPEGFGSDLRKPLQESAVIGHCRRSRNNLRCRRPAGLWSIVPTGQRQSVHSKGPTGFIPVEP